MNNLPATTTPTAPAQNISDMFKDDLSGIFDEGVRISPSNIILVQNTTKDPMGARPGQFLDTVTGNIYDQLEIVALNFQRNRVYFPAELGGAPLCRSDNAITPSPKVESPMASSCANCPRSKWTPKPGSKFSTKPDCSERLRLTAVEYGGVIPMYIGFSGKSFSPADAMRQLIGQRRMADSARGKRTETHDYRMLLTSKKEAGAKGVYYTMMLSGLRPVEQLGSYQDLFNNYIVNGLIRAQQQEDEYSAVNSMVKEILPVVEAVTI